MLIYLPLPLPLIKSIAKVAAMISIPIFRACRRSRHGQDNYFPALIFLIVSRPKAVFSWVDYSTKMLNVGFRLLQVVSLLGLAGSWRTPASVKWLTRMMERERGYYSHVSCQEEKEEDKQEQCLDLHLVDDVEEEHEGVEILPVVETDVIEDVVIRD